MAISLGNRAKMSTSTTGTGTITLGSASTGYQTFANAGITNGQTVRYAIEDGSNFEIGSGTYTASGTTLTRSVTESSNSDNAISLSGSAVVFVTATVADIFINDGASALTTTGVGTFASLDISGDVDVDGTLESDAITIGGTAVGSIFSPIAGGTGIVTTGALDAGSITSGFGAINNGASNITTTGVGTFASLDISGNIDVDGTANLDAVDIDGAVDMASTLLVTGVATLTAKPIADAGASVKNGATSAGFIEFFEDSNNGTNKVTLIGPASTADITLTLPATAGTIATTVSAADEATALAIALG